MRTVAMLLSLLILSPAMADVPSPAATSSQTSSPSASKPTASPAQSAKSEELTATEKSLLSQGYKLRIVDGEKKFCRRETALGSNLERTVCTTAARAEQSREDAREITERIQRNQANPNGH